jgi:hypothetical protein
MYLSAGVYPGIAEAPADRYRSCQVPGRREEIKDLFIGFKRLIEASFSYVDNGLFPDGRVGSQNNLYAHGFRNIGAVDKKVVALEIPSVRNEDE